MINYTVREIKKAILKVVNPGAVIYTTDIEEWKWELILNDGFPGKGWVSETTILVALAELSKTTELFKRYRDCKGRRFYIRIS